MKTIRLMCLALLVASGGATYGAEPKNGPSSLLTPQLTNKEIAAYQQLGGDEKAVQRFLETRQFLRRMTAFVAELPTGVEYAAVKHGAPQPTAGVDIEYALNFNEQLVLYDVCLLCGGCGGAAESAPTGDPVCGLKHPKQFECGKPADAHSVLSQLIPPATPQEKDLFNQANKCASAENPRFLATRKYMRELRKLEAALPKGEQLDPGAAPPIPALVDSAYLLHDEVYKLLDIQHAQLMKDLAGGNRGASTVK